MEQFYSFRGNSFFYFVLLETQCNKLSLQQIPTKYFEAKEKTMLLFPLNKKKVIMSIAIGLVSVIGDKNSEDQTNRLVSAVCDNGTHTLIGAFTWIAMFVMKTSNANIQFLCEVFFCGLLSSLIDLDHFVAAKSIHLKV